MTTFYKYLEVAVALPLNQTYTYSVPDSLLSLISIGKRVLVPFGKRRISGFIMGKGENSGHYPIKNILDVLDESPLFLPDIIPFFYWISDYYMHPIGEVIKSALPGGLTLTDSIIISITPKGIKALDSDKINPLEKKLLIRLQQGKCLLKTLCKNIEIPGAMIHKFVNQGWADSHRELHGKRTMEKTERFVSLIRPCRPVHGLSEKRKEIINILESKKDISLKTLKEYVPKSGQLITSMSKQGFLSIFPKPVYRDPFGESIVPDSSPELNQEQSDVVSKAAASFDKGFAAYLLAGVTGSGKTEVYMRLAAEAIAKNLPVIILVPEIALISQMERRFRARFGEQVAVLHSGLSSGERFDQWMRIIKKKAPIVVGARSAVFAPVENPGLIIVDEEHDTSYKQGADLLYNARDIAVVRAKLSGGIVILGSATPSVQSFYNVRTGKFKELALTKRVEKRPLPYIQIVDLRQTRDLRGARRFITQPLINAVKETLEKKEQVLLFLNRRGFASFPVCAACGESIRCEHCDITLTLHRLAGSYKCHYCGFTKNAPCNCSVCGSSDIKHLGLGTEKLEAAVKALFPEARVARMDRDTTTRKGSILKILKSLRNRAVDVLIGTQMVAKGHDFPNITLVGIICADLSLSFPDFRAGERTFQLLAQVAGRAGRGNVPGRVFLQTYAPEHFSIIAAKHQDFKFFYNTEIGFRKALNYPPFSRIIQLRISGKNIDKTRETAQVLGRLCREKQKKNTAFLRNIEILGPIEAPVAKIANQYRWQMLIKGNKIKELHQFTRQVGAENPKVFNDSKVKVIIDVDPFFMS
ncbi:Primosomal protein N [Desulfonema limicola]|uniref:Replication restart protein PriA n=1 Tax=Desulfonema limicola TaxID=45656 RepID=A0A975B5F2_9BACT|nr:primosomal protein N' [Desulfonema limicola]QTA79130.1 Primosomal protein N [Desulfonema limicola]